MVWRVLVLLQRALCFWKRTGQLFFSVFFTLPSRNLCTFWNTEGSVQPAIYLLLITHVWIRKSFQAIDCHLLGKQNLIEMFPDHLPSILHGALLVAVGSLYPTPPTQWALPPFCYVGMCFWRPAPTWVSPHQFTVQRGSLQLTKIQLPNNTKGKASMMGFYFFIFTLS
jgi:hypothetical protein